MRPVALPVLVGMAFRSSLWADYSPGSAGGLYFQALASSTRGLPRSPQGKGRGFVEHTVGQSKACVA